MGRAKPSIDDAVSLFPFLSILACIIGILVLMITAITLGQIGKDKAPAEDDPAAAQAAADAAARAEQYKLLRTQLKADVEAVAVLQDKVRKLESAQKDAAVRAANIADAKAEIKRLEEELKNKRENAAKLQAELEAKTKLLAQAEKDNAALDEKLKPLLLELERLRAELSKRTGPPEEAQVRVKPSGTGGDLDAEFVECAANSIVLHDRAEPLRIPSAQIGGHAEYLKLLDDIKKRPKGTVIFLIRPDGVGTYNAARNVARGRYVTNGKLAIGGQGKLDLTLFGKEPGK